MLKKILVLFLVVISVAACQRKPSEGMETASSGAEFSETGGLSGVEGGAVGIGGVDSALLGAPSGLYTEGSLEDFNERAGDRIFFGFDSFDLTSEAQDILRKQAAWLNLFPSRSIEIQGHADERGTREYNLALGEKRATSVKNFLVALGVGAHRINTISFGKERPAVLGSNDAAWAKNRRAVTVLN